MTPEEKLSKLKKIILGYNSCLVAFSGGVDSTFLLKIVSEVLPRQKILAVTVSSPVYPKEELLFSQNIVRQFGVRQKVIRGYQLRDKNFISNPLQRCYFCKKELFRRLRDIAARYKLDFVFDASNLSDERDFRPGNIARQELKIRSPLLEAGLSKDDIRNLSRKLGLSTWNKPSLACLATRIPFGMRISLLLLKQIHQAEQSLRKMGFPAVRIRHYRGLCRIEVPKNDIPRLLAKSKQVVDKLRKIGYNYITLDLEGYRSGSMLNEAETYRAKRM